MPPDPPREEYLCHSLTPPALKSGSTPAIKDEKKINKALLPGPCLSEKQRTNQGKFSLFQQKTDQISAKMFFFVTYNINITFSTSKLTELKNGRYKDCNKSMGTKNSMEFIHKVVELSRRLKITMTPTLYCCTI